ncbi:MAG: anhydro-N-acetylmuramic acid kinase [Motiliproteus sp.]|nr:anhydro-N-acetylmuramic acid kinase [Motiliproteus sp.]
MTAELYIGLMSGTSLDGVDTVLVDLSGDYPKLIASHLEQIPEDIHRELLALTQSGDNEIDRMGVADYRFADLQTLAIKTLLEKANVNVEQIKAIGSHGQTIRHRSEFDYPFTLQIGDPNRMAEQTGITVVADIRRRDMAAGGEGAPLVPAFHQRFLRSPEQDRMVVNIGGIANVTVLDRNPDISSIGYDTGPGNVLMDSWISRHQQENYDADGTWASSGCIFQPLLEQILKTSYLHQPPPKSTGRELFHIGWLDQHIHNCAEGVPAEDIQATLLEFTAQTISTAILSHGYSELGIYLCGGGASNSALTQRLHQLLAPHQVKTTDDLGIPAEWLEACAFAWLAQACLKGETGNLPSVTGAKGERILGAIYQA